MTPEPGEALVLRTGLIRLLKGLLVVVALGMLGYRFAHQDLAPFARDEPQFLTASREQLRTGAWLSANPLYGNMGVRYGPAAFWFYGVVQSLFGDDPRTAILAMGLLITLAHLAMAFALTNLFAEGTVFFAVVLAWIASSPYEFYWSRLAWDLTSNAGVAWAVVLLCLVREWRMDFVLALGVILGVAFSTHLSVTPFVVGVGIALGLELSERPRRLAAVGSVLAAAVLVVSAPYLLFLLRAPVVERAPRQALTLAAASAWLLEAPRVATTWGVRYLFGPSWADFQEWLGPWALPAFILSVVGLLVCLAGGVAGLVLTFVAPDVRQRRVSRTALVAWLGSGILLAALGLEPHPHYQFSSAWVPVFGVVACLAWLRRRGPRAGAAALAVLGGIALAQFMLITQGMDYISHRGGTRGAPYATPIGLEIRAMDTVCGAPESRIVLWNETAMYPFPFEYLATTEKACHGKTVVVCSPAPGSLTKPCPAGVEGSRLRRLSYADARGGALRVD